MHYLKTLLKLILGIISIIVFCFVIMVNAENYEIVKSGKTDTEIKTIFRKKISECSLDSNGLYDGPAKTWHLFSNNLRNEGQFQKGLWHGRWKEYDHKGHLTMIRVWNQSKLNQLFLPNGREIIEVEKTNWPESANVIQQTPQRMKE